MYHQRRGTQERLIEGMTRDEVCERYQSKIILLARRLSERLPRACELTVDDLVSFGAIGLLEAFERYDARKGILFTTFAEYRIGGAMMDALRSSDSFSRHRRQLSKRVRDAQQHLTMRLGRVPTPQEVAEKMELSLDAYWSALEKTTPVTYVRIEDVDSPEGDESGRQYGETLPAHDGEDAMDILVREESRQKIREAIGGLSERKRQCVLLYYGREMTLAEIAAVFKVTPSRVSQILTECRKDLKRHLKGEVSTLDLALKVAL